MAINMFDGAGGRSSGVNNGYSTEIAENTGPVSLFVGGVFGTAVVTLQRFSLVQSAFVNTDILWTRPGLFQGLVLASGERYRLDITSASGTTAVFAEKGRP